MIIIVATAISFSDDRRALLHFLNFLLAAETVITIGGQMGVSKIGDPN